MNIICFETEWLYNHQETNNRFNLNSRPVLQWLKDFHNIDIIHRSILTRDDLKYYMKYFSDRRRFKKYQLIYFSTHGQNHAIYLEGEEEPRVDLQELALMNPYFFEDRVIHFSSCTTMKNKDAIIDFKNQTNAQKVSGYCRNIDAMDSAVLDMAYLNALQNFTVKTLEKETSKFQKRYASLIDYLEFCIV